MKFFTSTTLTPDENDMKPINQDIEEIVLKPAYWKHDDWVKAKAALVQREAQLLEYIALMYGLPIKELQRTVELWRNK
jgi:hypothetical protein